MKRRHLAAAATAAGLMLGGGWWLAADSAPADGVAPASPPPVAMAAPAASSASAPWRGTGPRRPLPEADAQAQRTLWQDRLARARQVREAYAASTRYPPESRPASEHTDRLDPHPVVREEMPLRVPGAPVRPGFTLRTTQDRVYLQGDEAVRVTVAAVDENGRPLPLQITRAIAHEGATGQKGSTHGETLVSFRDDGAGGDLQAGDGELTLRFQPSAQGFAELDGVVRIEMGLQSGEQMGYAFFDVIHTPAVPATWLPGVREAVEGGSLNLYLPLQVQQPGRYVITGRVDDAAGKPFALVSFNEELAAGTREVKLQLFGKLLRDQRASFPLKLRDVDGFLLHPDRFPDRALLANRDGLVYRTQPHALSEFTDAEWHSEERDRYLTEYDKDVAEAEQHLQQLGTP